MAAAITGTNLTTFEQDRRLRIGVAWFTFSLLLTVVVLSIGLAQPFRLLLFLPFSIAMNWVFMGLYKA